jgi:hypothetical protein
MIKTLNTFSAELIFFISKETSWKEVSGKCQRVKEYRTRTYYRLDLNQLLYQ